MVGTEKRKMSLASRRIWWRWVPKEGPPLAATALALALLLSSVLPETGRESFRICTGTIYLHRFSWLWNLTAQIDWTAIDLPGSWSESAFPALMPETKNQGNFHRAKNILLCIAIRSPGKVDCAISGGSFLYFSPWMK